MTDIPFYTFSVISIYYFLLYLEKETKAAADSTAAAAGTQAGAAITDGPEGGGAAAGGERPNLSELKTPDEIIAALDQAENAGAGASAGAK